MPPKWSGRIGNTGILDLTWAKSQEDLAEITAIENVGVVRAPEDLYTFVCSIPMEHVGVVEPATPGRRMELTGNTRIGGDFLANGDAETALAVTGNTFVTPPLERIGFRELRVIGNLFVPRGSEAALGAKLRHLIGNIIYYPADKGIPRFWMDGESISREFLELLTEAMPFVIMGQVAIEDDVTADLLRSKVSEIVLAGTLKAPKSLLPLLQVLTVEKMGSIVAKEAAPWGEEEK